jgi:thiol:disulfide interchange protein DsbD
LIPITVSYFGGKSQHLRRQIWMHSACYLLGLTFTNSLLGVAASLSGKMLGSILQHPLTFIFIALFMVVLALNFFGFWEMQIPAWLTRVTAKNYKGYFGTFFMGLTLGIVAAPCLGPFILGLIIYVAQLGDPLLGFLYFFALSLGLGLPLTILALFSGLLDKLPLSGDWMIWIRKFFGWVLIGMAVHFINTIIPWDIEEAFLWAGVAVAAALHLGWLEPSGKGSIRFRRIKRIAGLMIFLAGMVYLGVEQFSERPAVAWIAYSESEITRAVQEQKPVILDFSAKWCLPCRIMDKGIFQAAEVRQLERTIVFLRLDLTFQQPQQKQIMDQYSIRGVPSILFFNRQGKEEKGLRVEELVSRAEFMRRIKELMRRSGP